MRKLSEFEGDEALDALAELIEPATEIMSDKALAEAFRSKDRIKAVKMIITDHKKSITQILAILDGEDPATYKPKLVTLPIKILEVLNDPDLEELFS